MENKNKVILTFIILIFLITFLYFFSDWFSKTTGYSIEEDPDITLAKCLTEKGIILYGAKACSECQKQIQLFGNKAFENINYIICNGEGGACQEILSVPAWDIDGTIYYGIKSTSQLRSLSGCVE